MSEVLEKQYQKLKEVGDADIVASDDGSSPRGDEVNELLEEAKRSVSRFRLPS